MGVFNFVTEITDYKQEKLVSADLVRCPYMSCENLTRPTSFGLSVSAVALPVRHPALPSPLPPFSWLQNGGDGVWPHLHQPVETQ